MGLVSLGGFISLDSAAHLLQPITFKHPLFAIKPPVGVLHVLTGGSYLTGNAALVTIKAERDKGANDLIARLANFLGQVSNSCCKNERSDTNRPSYPKHVYPPLIHS